MAAKKRKKVGASAKAGATRKKTASKAKKAKKAPAMKAKKTARKAAKRRAKKAKKTAAKKAPAKKAGALARAAATIKKAFSRPKKAIGEGDYAASRRFDKDEASFVKKNKAGIPAMGKEAETALDGPDGAALREAEATAAARSRDIF